MEVASPPARSHTPTSTHPSPERILEDRHNNNSDSLKDLRSGAASMTSDIEQFQGKIVYNPDGSAYIIEDAEFSDDEDLDLPTQEGSIVEKAGGESSEVDQFPTIENAVYVSRTKSQYPSYVRAQTSAGPGGCGDRPTVHSYRVYNYRHKSSDKPLEAEDTSADNVPVKPILMCFICKLSFGNTKSFKNHCMDDHSLEFNDEELDNLKTENISALVQPVGKDKSPLISFLQPVTKSQNSLPLDQVPRIQSPSKSPGEGGIRVRNDLASLQQISPVLNGGVSHVRDTESPGEGSMSPSPNSYSPMGYPLKGTTIGACPEHIQGRPTGVECAKCDLILNSNRLGSVQAWNASNNACKTLKCPKCNWHYKYQETLEIHMKEKHPDSETTCIYCITGQQHPRLARGETYTCGYKPYRCEVCNYSTTTKGNLSIHMQSDKHINNMQELQNNGGEAPTSPSPSQSSNKYVTPSSTPKPQDLDQKDKPNWRCDICNYETNIARNLRIHMTSEKHMNNIMNLQGLPNLEGGGAGGPGANLPMPNFPNLPNVSAAGPGLQQLLGMPRLPGGMNSSPMKEAAMADMAFNQALLMQMMGGGQGLPGMPGIPFLPPGGPPGAGGDCGPEQMDMEQADPNPRLLYNCAVCREFSCDHLQALSEHLSIDRTKQRESEVSLMIGGTYICKLCSYKTNLKANFQLHCKTDKHLQKLQLVNHIMEGGPNNEWKLNFMNVSNSVQLRCNACDFYTDSIHKLQIHTANQGHEVSAAIFNHLRKIENEEVVGEAEQLWFNCTLCKHTSPGKAMLLQHCRSVKHLQMEQLHLLQRRAEGAQGQPDISDIFTVTKSGNEKDQLKSEDKEDSSKEETSKDESIDMDTADNNTSRTDNNETDTVTCPLCQENFKDKDTLEEHAMSLHSINGEGLARLMMLMQGSHWLNSNKNKEEEESSDSSKHQRREGEESQRNAEMRDRSPTAQMDKYHDPARPYKCDVCRESFTQKSILLVHYNSVGHLRSLKRKMQDSGAPGPGSDSAAANEALNSSSGGDSELDKSQSSDTVAPSPKKEEQAPGGAPDLGELQNALQGAMLAARLQLLNPMLRGQMPPGMNPMAMAMGLPNSPFGNPAAGGMGQLQHLQQLAMAQHMSGGNARMPDPAQLLAQLAGKSTPEKQPEMKLPFPNSSPIPPVIPQQHQHQHQSMSHDAYGEQKRARTKITEDQLKVLRSHFDISNSPSDEQIQMMAQHTGLPPKVIKHWFRNTLFKERQKNKDSPYNFNNPPSTVINLEEYEKTGEPQVQSLYPEVELNEEPDEIIKDTDISRTDKHHEEEIISDDERDDGNKTEVSSNNGLSGQPGMQPGANSLPPNLTLSSILSSQTMADSLLSNYPPQLANPFRQSTESNTFSQMLHNLAANNSNISEPSSPGSMQRLSPGQDMNSIHGKRANRTRFSDYQVKVLQEFFEKNAYPKDDDLEYLSKLLGITPRVIVVWFQNARQKARKAYENQPSNEVVTDDMEGRFTRTPSLSYQCKKCNLEFQRYYELIRHQKQHCFKEEDAKRSALAQKAAGHAAATLSSGGGQPLCHSENSNSSFSERNITSPIFNQNTMSWKRKPSMEEIEEPRSKLPKTTNLFPPLVPPTASNPAPGGGNDLEASMRKFYEDTMKRYMDELSVRPASQQQSDGQALDLRSSSADLDQGSNRSENDNDSDSWDKSGGEDSSSEQPRGGMYVDGSDFDGEPGDGSSGMSGNYLDANGQRDANNKRFRTHMSNVQVKMMKSIFEAYKTPTMPECLGLGNQIGLQKRVVQVWFQNARAKEKKAKLYLQQLTSQEPEMPPAPRGCRWCNFEYPANYSVQEHIFQPKHTENVRLAIEQGLYDPESPGATLNQLAESLQNNVAGGNYPRPAATPPRGSAVSGQDGSNTDSSPSPSKPNLGPGLSMMMAAGGLHSPGRPDLPDSRLLMPPFYGMNQGLNSYPIGVTNTVHNV